MAWRTRRAPRGRYRYRERVDVGGGPGSYRRLEVPPNCDLTLGMVCTDKRADDRTVWEMVADGRFANPVGNLQGGFLAAFADSAMAATAVRWALRSNPARRVRCANAEMKMSFFAPVAVGTPLTCGARVLSGGSRVIFVEAEVCAADHLLVAKASSTYIATVADA